MVQRIGGSRRKSRSIMKKPLKEKGKISITKYFKEFKDGDKVLLKAEPSVQKGLFHLRFHGKVGIVQNKKGTCYEVEIKDLNKKKTVIVHPSHLRKL
ncbi:MAG: 50S ribosomal protein L21e [Candidatus Woesearchaeota archaeon]